MTPLELQALAKAHGALAWAAVAVLLAAVVTVWWGRAASAGRARAIARWAVPGAALLGAATFATGVALHGPFQGKLRQKLFLASESLGWLFERKEHAAFGALALALSAVFAAWAERAAPGRPAGTEGSHESGGAAATLAKACLLAMCAALVLEALALGVSIAVAGRVGF